jgi:NDP-sugar pyrophosphorylase family protein
MNDLIDIRVPPRHEDLDVMLLVGGLGTRLRSVIGEHTPKPLALVRGRPFLWYLLRTVADQGFRHVILATSHLSESFQTDLQSYVPDGLDVRFSFETSPRGTGGAIVEGLPTVNTDPFIVMNGDSFIKVSLDAMLKAHHAAGAVATVALLEVPNVARYGTVLAEKDGSITAFQEKSGLEEPGWINGGVYVLSKAALDPVATEQTSSIEKDVFPYWVGKGLHSFKVQSPFIDIGLPETYEAAGRFFEDCGYA